MFKSLREKARYVVLVNQTRVRDNAAKFVGLCSVIECCNIHYFLD